MLTLSPFFSSFTGSQVIIPVGARAFSVDCVSGSAYVGGALLIAGKKVEWTSPGDKTILGSTIAAGTTGSANLLTVFYLQ